MGQCLSEVSRPVSSMTEEHTRDFLPQPKVTLPSVMFICCLVILMQSKHQVFNYAHNEATTFEIIMYKLSGHALPKVRRAGPRSVAGNGMFTTPVTSLVAVRTMPLCAF